VYDLVFMGDSGANASNNLIGNGNHRELNIPTYWEDSHHEYGHQNSENLVQGRY